ncbi:MAG: RHS repeat-associated core domain-containing protein [Acholeplasmataceae bacterium]
MKKFLKAFDTNEIRSMTHRLERREKAIAIIILCAMFLSLIPYEALSATTNNVYEEEVQEVSELDEELNIYDYGISKQDIPIVGEDQTKRTENEKHFLKEDGSFEVVLYNGAVHYKKDNEWLDIDNSISYNSKTKMYENTANKYNLKFPKDISKQNISLSMNEYEVDWNYMRADSSSINIGEKAKKVNEKDLTELINISQKVTYSNINKDVDLIYNVDGSKIKEEIIVNSFQENLVFEFEYKLKNLFFDQTDENLVLVNQNHEIVFIFDPFVMIDDQQTESSNIEYYYEEIGKDTYKLTIIPDKQWLQDANYPVVIDPTIDSSTTSMSIYDTYISESSPDSTYYSSNYMYLSGTSSTTEYKGLIYFYLPSTIMDQTITYASMKFTKSTVTTGQINIYQNTENFSSSTATWNNAPGYDTRVIDYYTINSNTPFIFDITESVKDWQNQGLSRTPGFTITLDEGYGYFNSVYQNGVSTTSYRPLITIGYENPSGLKDYWTYSSQEMGVLGTGYISDYTGNLTWIRNEYSLENEYMSLNLSMYYNHYDKNTNIGYGYGWNTNFGMQLLFDSSLSKYYLKKSDGGKIYFYFEETINSVSNYIAEDGSLMELEISSTSRTITTSNNIQYKFETTTNGRLIKITNLNTEHDINITYSDVNLPKVSSAYDEIGNKITFTYNSTTGLLSYTRLYLIQSNDTFKQVEFKYYTYDSYSNLNYVYNYYNYDLDTAYKSTYTLDYDFDSTHSFVAAENITLAQSLTFEYDTSGRVINFQSNDSLALTSQKTISYANGSTTYTDFNNETIKYRFDNYGHTINIIDSYGNSLFYKYAGLFTYSKEQDSSYTLSEIINSEPNFRNVHKLLQSSSLLKQQQNLITNHGFEVDSGWNFIENTGNIEYTNNEYLIGERSLAITNDGSNPYATETVYLKAGNYTIQVYIKNGGTPIGNSGAYMSLSNITTFYGASSRVYNSDEWIKFSIGFNVSTDRYIAVNLNNDSISTAYFDKIELYSMTNDTRYNELTNSGFENSTLGWTRSGTYLTTNNEALGYEEIVGDYSFYIDADGSSSKTFYQEIPNLATYAGETYMIGGWAKADAVPSKSYGEFDVNGNLEDIYSDGRFFGLYVIFHENYYIEEFGTYIQWDDTVYLPFDSSIEDWQYQMYSIELPEYVISATVYGMYRGEGRAYFDNIQLYHDDISVNYTYNNEGLVKGIYSEGNITTYDYDSNGNMTSYSVNDVSADVSYNTDNLVKQVVSNNIYVAIEYDASTNHIVSQNYGYDLSQNESNQEAYFKTTTTYQLDSQYINIVTNEFGNTTDYDYTEANGLVSQLTDGNGNIIRYEYDNLGKILNKYFGENDEIEYIYKYDTSNRLESITVDDIIYSFGYNSYDQLTSVKINSVTAISFTYYTKTNINGDELLTSQIETKTYGNGDVYIYNYDDEDRLIKMTLNGSTLFQYEYDTSNKLSVVKDISNSKIFYYTYDLSGRIDHIVDESNNKIQYTYDSRGNINSYTYEISGISRTVFYSYDYYTGAYDFTIYSTSNGIAKFDYNYDDDSLQRLRELIVTVSNTEIMEMTYNYDDNKVVNGNATTRVYNIVYTFGNSSGFKYFYSYDGNQNITKIVITSIGGIPTEEYDYKYDQFNQLIREDIKIYNSSESKSISYSYDDTGNITSIKEYNYTSPTVVLSGTPISSKILTYNGTKLNTMTYYINGIQTGFSQYSYDDYGNPTMITNNGQNDMYDWNGRKLSSIDFSNGNEVSYSYNDIGIRVSQVTNNHTYEYVLDETKVLVEIIDGTNYLYYSYNNDDKLISFNYMGNEYFYVYDNLGNVVALLNSIGTIVAKYRYDAWGNNTVLDANGNVNYSSSFIGNINPYRFKGYRFDSETGFYYLQSRYYDSSIGRFISMDDINYLSSDTAVSINLYIYCDNNPIMGFDPMGTWNWKKFGATVFLGASITALVIVTGGSGLLIAGVVFTTLVNSYAAGEEKTAVMDVSVSIPTGAGTFAKFGISFVMDYKHGTFEKYVHAGGGAGVAAGPSYEVGLIENYAGEGSYRGSFYTRGASVPGFGLEYATDGKGTDDSVSATSIIVGPSGSGYMGYDYYIPFP